MQIIDLSYNEQLPVADKELYKSMKDKFVSDNERTFFENMIRKEIYDFPASSFDVIMHEKDNEDGLFIDKCYDSEYKVGRKTDGRTAVISVLPQSLSELLQLDLYEVLNKHISVLDWLRQRDYSGVRYDYPWEE